MVGEPSAEKVCAWVAGMPGGCLIQEAIKWNTRIGQMQGDFRIIVLEPRPELGNVGDTSTGVRCHRIVSFCCTCRENRASLIIVQNVTDSQVSLFLFDFRFQISDFRLNKIRHLVYSFHRTINSRREILDYKLLRPD
jgi:hypothetical protein